MAWLGGSRTDRVERSCGQGGGSGVGLGEQLVEVLAGEVHWNGLAEVVVPGRMWLGTGVVVLWVLPPLPLALTPGTAAPVSERETDMICRG